MVTQARSPQFLLFSEASTVDGSAPRWKFVLQSVGCDDQFAAGDVEPGTPLARLELLAVVRGLEAIDQPSHVTLVTRSRYVARGIRRELSQWRDRSWHWEKFGKLVPIRDGDLWQRIDRALTFHRVDCVRPSGYRQSIRVTDVAGPTVEMSAAEPALLIVPRLAARGWARHRREWAFSRPVGRIFEGVLATFAAFLRPAFTRAV
jgi:ribonuclease HI